MNKIKIKMETEIKKIFEMMKKLNPDFTLSEASFPTFNNQQSGQQPQQGGQQQQQFIPKTGDAKAYNKSQEMAKTANKKSAKINTAMEFPEAFKIWFNKLGYSPDKGNITIARVTSEIRKAMLQLGYK